MVKQKGNIALIPLLLLVVAGAVVYILFSKGVIKNPVSQVIKTESKQPNVSMQTQYQNPFDKGSQYVNPFAKYKNPFDFIK